MFDAIKAETRKIFTIRSTYVVFFLVFALLTLLGFYVEGVRNSTPADFPGKFASIISNTVTTTTVFASIVAILLVTHEYRYNTIMHTLTLARRRLQVLAAKIVVISVFAVVFCVVSVALALALTEIGLAVNGVDLVPQTVYYADIVWRSLFYSWGYSMLALLIAVIIRNQVGSVVTFLFMPTTIEPLMSLILKSNVIYLPFNVLSAVLNDVRAVTTTQGLVPVNMTHTKATWLFLLYMLVGWLIAAVLFVRRDAN